MRPAPKVATLRNEGLPSGVKTKPLEDLLAEYVGPLARILVKRAALKAPNSGALIEILKGEIAGPKEQAAFVKQAQALGMD